MAEVKELIDRLTNFRTRSAAKDALIEKGQEAVGPLIAALRSGQVSVRWSAVTILGQLGAKEAVTDLVGLLNDSEVRDPAKEALQRITGEDFGDDYEAWKHWLEVGGGGAGPASQLADNVATDADLVKEAVYNTDVSAEERPPGYVLRVPFANRHQDVALDFKAKDSEDVPLVVAYTRCGLANPKHYEWALRQNVRMLAGAIAIADIEGKGNFVVADVMIRSTVTPRILIESVRRLARKGDQLESALTKADEY